MTGASRATPGIARDIVGYRAWSSQTRSDLTKRLLRYFRTIHDPLLKSNSQQAENCHIKAQLCDCRMAEQLSEPAQMQDRPKGKDDSERHHRVADERRDEDAANDQLGE